MNFSVLSTLDFHIDAHIATRVYTFSCCNNYCCRTLRSSSKLGYDDFRYFHFFVNMCGIMLDYCRDQIVKLVEYVDERSEL